MAAHLQNTQQSLQENKQFIEHKNIKQQFVDGLLLRKYDAANAILDQLDRDNVNDIFNDEDYSKLVKIILIDIVKIRPHDKDKYNEQRYPLLERIIKKCPIKDLEGFIKSMPYYKKHALHFIATRGDIYLLKILLQRVRGFDINTSFNFVNPESTTEKPVTALMLATVYTNPELVRFLISNGANIDGRSNTEKQLSPDEEEKYTATVTAFLSSTSMNITNYDQLFDQLFQLRPLDAILAMNINWSRHGALEYFEKNKPEVVNILQEADELFTIARTGLYPRIARKLLLKGNASIHQRNQYGQTPIEVAQQFHQQAMVKLFALQSPLTWRWRKDQDQDFVYVENTFGVDPDLLQDNNTLLGKRIHDFVYDLHEKKAIELDTKLKAINFEGGSETRMPNECREIIISYVILFDPRCSYHARLTIATYFFNLIPMLTPNTPLQDQAATLAKLETALTPLVSSTVPQALRPAHGVNPAVSFSTVTQPVLIPVVTVQHGDIHIAEELPPEPNTCDDESRARTAPK